jgi:hypothetical protein
MPNFQHLRRRSRLSLYKVMTAWHSLFDNIFNHYRPELYYMRGPGPKWRAKHDL